MNEKVAFITDIHFDCRGGSAYFIRRYELFFEKVFFPYLKKHKIKTVINLGDTWENRKYVNTQSLKKSREMFFDKLKENDITMYCLLGNHDVTYRNTNQTNSMDLLESAYDNIILINEYDEIEIGNTKIGLMSWVNNENYERNIERLKSANVDVMCGHYEIKTFIMTHNNYCEHGLSPDLFQRFKMTLSGHFHINSKHDKIEYLGNPFQTNWGDYGYQRGFHVMDTKTQKKVFVENTFNNYEVIEYQDGQDYDYTIFQDKIVKVITPPIHNLNQSQYMDFLGQLKEVAYEFTIMEKSDVDVGDIPEQVKLLSKKEMIDEYVTGMNIQNYENEVKAIMSDLYKQAVIDGVVE